MNKQEKKQIPSLEIMLYILMIFSVVFLTLSFLGNKNIIENLHTIIVSTVVLILCIVVVFLVNYGKNQRNIHEVELLDESYNKTIEVLKNKEVEINEISEIFRQYCQVISKK